MFLLFVFRAINDWATFTNFMLDWSWGVQTSNLDLLSRVELFAFTMLVLKNNFLQIMAQYKHISLLFSDLPLSVYKTFWLLIMKWASRGMNINNPRAWVEFLRSCWLVNKRTQTVAVLRGGWKGANWLNSSYTEICHIENDSEGNRGYSDLSSLIISPFQERKCPGLYFDNYCGM